MQIGKKTFDFKEHAYIMGILNVTPDSFSDGGKFSQIDDAIKQALQMIREGADIIDIGGESTRPGHGTITIKEEISRVVPVITQLIALTDIPISIDTSKGAVARAALDAGASMINDIWGFKNDQDVALAAKQYNVPVCLMHNRQSNDYSNLIENMMLDLCDSLNIAELYGIPRSNIILDPGIGFAKTIEDNLNVMKNLERFTGFDCPLLLGTSRKSMIGLTLDLPVTERLEGTLATTVMGYMKGARIFRVHDIKENLRVLKMTEAMS